MVEAFVDGEEFGDHEGGEAGIRVEQGLDEAQVNALGEGRP